MPRTATGIMSIAKLKSLLRNHEARRAKLVADRKKLLAQLARIDAQIAQLDGGAGSSGPVSVARRGRSQNAKSLVTHMTEILAQHPKGMAVGDLVDAIKAAGYKSSSTNFRGIVNQTLIKENKKFKSVARGIYTLRD